MVKTCSFQIVTIAIADRIDHHSDGNFSLEFRVYKSVTKSVFLTHSELLNNWRPKDNFRFDPISDREERNHLVCNNFCAAIFFLLFLYFKSRGQISRVTCAVVTRLPAPENWYHRHSGKMTAHDPSRLRDFRATRNGRHRNKPRQNGGKLKFPASVLFSLRIRSSQTS